MDMQVHELAVEILKQNSLMTMKEAVELAKKIIADQKRDQEEQCNLPRR
jgi:hypothetical protein